LKAHPKPKLARRLSFSEREARILDAAILLFSEKGFKGTTTRAIAERAGVNEALLFRHFKSKEDLYSALLNKKFHDYESEVHPALVQAGSQSVEKALADVAKLIIEKNRMDPSFFRMMLFSSLENHKLSRLFLQHRLPITEFLDEFFKAKIADGTLRLQNPGILSRAFLALVNHYILVSQIFQAPEFYPVSEQSLMAQYINIFTRGILA
jgi:Transcriptional regulator